MQLSVPIHFFVVVLVFSGDDLLPPGLVIQIPADRLFDAVLKFRIRQPAQLVVDLGGIDGVAHVMALAVCHVGDETLGFTELMADELDDVDVAHLIVSAHVVDLTLMPLADDEVDGLAVILHIQPVAHVQALTINRKRFVVEAVCDHERDQLLGEMIRAVVVGAAGDRHRQAVSAVIRLYQQVRARLGAGIRGAGVDRRGLGKEQIGPVQRQIAVDLVRGHLVEAPEAMLAAGIDLSGLELPFINWTLSGDTLTISGKGAMPDYSTTTPPWEEHKKEIKQIVIEPGITHIGTQSFQYCSNVEFVSLPDTVTSIGKAAFFKCESLPEIELPAGLRFLGGQVFDHCLSLESAVIPEGVSRLNDAIFNCCENLISVTIPVSVTEIGNSAFNGCGKLRDVYYNGRPRDWKEIEIAPYNKMLLNAGVYSQNCVGETFLYGTYEQDNELVNDKEPIEWVILERDGKRLLAISKYVLDCQPFDMGNTPVTWESCSLRKWLNETFLDAAFSAEEQERLQTVILSEDGDRPYTSQDRVFLLSADEGDQYFASANERICRTTESCLASFQANHIAVNANGVVFWWLRTPGIDSDCERIVFEDGSMPNLVTSGLPGGVRPAVWLDQVPDAVLREASAASG